MEEVEAGHRGLVIGTPDKVRAFLYLRENEEILPGRTADAVYLIDERTGEIPWLAVRVDTARLYEITDASHHSRLALGYELASEGGQKAARRRALIAILIHEVWGHAVPLLQAGTSSGFCADPNEGEPPLSACVIQRENQLRREIGFAPLRSYALQYW